MILIAMNVWGITDTPMLPKPLSPFNDPGMELTISIGLMSLPPLGPKNFRQLKWARQMLTETGGRRECFMNVWFL